MKNNSSFVDKNTSLLTIEKGLSTKTIKEISKIKNEPK
jgi:hypothetical protein